MSKIILSGNERDLENAFKAGFYAGRNPTIGIFGKYDRSLFIDFLTECELDEYFRKCKCK